jgi:hypothetical protein
LSVSMVLGMLFPTYKYSDITSSVRSSLKIV